MNAKQTAYNALALQAAALAAKITAEINRKASEACGVYTIDDVRAIAGIVERLESINDEMEENNNELSR